MKAFDCYLDGQWASARLEVGRRAASFGAGSRGIVRGVLRRVILIEFVVKVNSVFLLVLPFSITQNKERFLDFANPWYL